MTTTKDTMLLLLPLLFLGTVFSLKVQAPTKVEDYMNVCMDGRNHKSTPGPEAGLAREICSPWAERSCCSKDTANGIKMEPNWLNFNWNHCDRPLSDRCREYMVMDLCFYECEPNVGPWLVDDAKKIRNERFMGVPLCRSDCDNWWNSCNEDFTCLYNWAQGFNWTSGINTCPFGSHCKKINEYYKDSTDFCENLMGGSFKVTDDAANCFYLWFDPAYGNPNTEVARKRASEILDIPYHVTGEQTGSNHGNMATLARHSLMVTCFSFVMLFACREN